MFTITTCSQTKNFWCPSLLAWVEQKSPTKSDYSNCLDLLINNENILLLLLAEKIQIYIVKLISYYTAVGY